ncbi:IclR family transcriptional regulator [Rhodococcus opacus]|uniref:IclR family transcriptional regulator n=1 Tax=Rhodococcus opacus TaxID=37919 RepID=UPI000ACB851C|nr:IclR family transcriptional regulator [Rhodococcus opacus]
MSSTPHTDPPTSGLDRAALILDTFDGPGRLNLAQVVRRTGVSRSSAHRILERLVQLRWLRRDGRDYELGMRLFELGSLAVHQDRLHQAALPYLHELQRLTGHVVHLAVLDGVDVVYLDKIGPRFGARLPSRIGGRQPAHCTGVGKALLAHLSHSERERFLVAADPRGSRPRGLAEASRLRAELTRIRDRGIAVDRQESMVGITCIGVPVGNPGNVVAGLSVCGPAAHMQPEHTLATPLRIAARDITRALAAAEGGYSVPILRPQTARPA